MTREEAIYCMKSYINDDSYEHCANCPYYAKNNLDSNVYVCESRTAHEMAIKALEQEPKILDTLNFAIDASNGDTNYFVGFRNGLRYSKSLIDGKEPQFESCAEQEPCEDCISRQAVLSMQYRIDDSATLSTRDVVNVDDIEDLPSIQPIRHDESCGDCVTKNNVITTICQYGTSCERAGKVMMPMVKVKQDLVDLIDSLPSIQPTPKTDVLNKIKSEIKEWYWQADKQALAKDACVVDAMVDLFIRTIDKYTAEKE